MCYTFRYGPTAFAIYNKAHEETIYKFKPCTNLPLNDLYIRCRYIRLFGMIFLSTFVKTM